MDELKLTGVWGDKYSVSGLNIKIEKRDGRVFFISPVDIEEFLKLQQLLIQKEKVNSEIRKIYGRIR